MGCCISHQYLSSYRTYSSVLETNLYNKSCQCSILISWLWPATPSRISSRSKVLLPPPVNYPQPPSSVLPSTRPLSSSLVVYYILVDQYQWFHLCVLFEQLPDYHRQDGHQQLIFKMQRAHRTSKLRTSSHRLHWNVYLSVSHRSDITHPAHPLGCGSLSS